MPNPLKRLSKSLQPSNDLRISRSYINLLRSCLKVFTQALPGLKAVKRTSSRIQELFSLNPNIIRTKMGQNKQMSENGPWGNLGRSVKSIPESSKNPENSSKDPRALAKRCLKWWHDLLSSSGVHIPPGCWLTHSLLGLSRAKKSKKKHLHSWYVSILQATSATSHSKARHSTRCSGAPSTPQMS